MLASCIEMPDTGRSVQVPVGLGRKEGRKTHSLVAVGAEQACVVAFLHHDVGDAWLILLLKADTGLTDGQQLIIQHLREREKRKPSHFHRVLSIEYSHPTLGMTPQLLFLKWTMSMGPFFIVF